MKGWVDQRLAEYAGTPDFETQQVLLDVTEQIAVAMEATGMKRADLARRLGVSRSYITKVLEGRPNLTVNSLVRVALALDSGLKIKLEPTNSVRWWQRGTQYPFEVNRHEQVEAQASTLAVAA